MKRSFLRTFTRLAGLAVGGCGLQRGNTVMTYDSFSKDPPPMNTVQRGGTYSLYPSDSPNPIVTKELQSGDRYGFAKNSNGKVVGEVVINGQEQQIALTSKLSTAYYWKKQ